MSDLHEITDRNILNFEIQALIKKENGVAILDCYCRVKVFKNEASSDIKKFLRTLN